MRDAVTDIAIDYDPANLRCTVTVSMDVPEAAPGGQLAKPELKANVIEHHLLTHCLARAVAESAATLLTDAPDAIDSNVQDNPAE